MESWGSSSDPPGSPPRLGAGRRRAGAAAPAARRSGPVLARGRLRAHSPPPDAVGGGPALAARQRIDRDRRGRQRWAHLLGARLAQPAARLVALAPRRAAQRS